jgi:hypothetical protein
VDRYFQERGGYAAAAIVEAAAVVAGNNDNNEEEEEYDLNLAHLPVAQAVDIEMAGTGEEEEEKQQAKILT